MVFSSFEFLFRFLPVFLLIYFVAPQKYRNAVLFAGSMVFYTIGEAEYVLLLFASVAVNYALGRIMYQRMEKSRAIKQKMLLIAALIYNFGLLFFFKYSGLTDQLPLGISFYTFQITAYMIDVYRGNIPAEQSLICLGAYLTMFPQLVAGPIVNYSEVRRNLAFRIITPAKFEEGIRTLIIGLGSKVIIADRIGLLWNSICMIGFNSISTQLAWMGAFAYSMELYFDFAGYSMMAVGLGKMLGFQFPANFCFPYISKSVTEFWRRWHITLGRWFREYVYIPLGGNRKGKKRTFLNMLVVWCLTALWHGCGYNFLIWGGLLLVFMSAEKLYLLPYLEKSKVISHLYLVIVVPITWVAFAITDTGELGTYYNRMFSFFSHAPETVNGMDWIKYLQNYWSLFFAGILFATPIPYNIYNRVRKSLAGTAAIAAVLVLSIYYLTISNNNPFLYFNF